MRYNYMDVISKQLCTRGKYKCERPSRRNAESERFTLGREERQDRLDFDLWTQPLT